MVPKDSNTDLHSIQIHPRNGQSQERQGFNRCHRERDVHRRRFGHFSEVVPSGFHQGSGRSFILGDFNFTRMERFL